MAKHRVVVHCMHERELGAAWSLMPNASAGEGIVVGELDDADIARLEGQNILVQRLDAPAPEGFRRIPVRAAQNLAMSGAMGLMATPPAPAPPPPPAGAAVQYRVSLAGPLLGAWRQKLESTGVKVVETLSGQSLRVIMPPGASPAVAGLPFVLGVAPWTAGSDAEASEVTASAPAPGTAAEMVTYDVLLVDPDMHQAVRAWLHDHHVAIAGAAGDKFRIHLLQDSSLAEELQARTDWVLKVEPYVPPALHNDVARVLVGLDPARPRLLPPSLFPGITLRGEGQVIGVADTGIDETHGDFTGRLANVIALGRAGDASDTHGHGTHVTGSIAGSGAASGGKLRGMAPGAKIVFQSLLDAQGGLGGLPFRLQDLFQEAYDLGARIHNDSWGSRTFSSYRVNSSEVDAFVHEHRDMLIVLSAGNDGTAADPPIGTRQSQKGYVNWLSVGSPATSKNALTVGASRSSRTSGGLAANRYGDWPGFPDDPINEETVSGDPECLMGFSSRGPCDNYRIKPDVVAPGTDILSCRSGRAPLRNFWGPGPQSAYAYMGGTSMAAPIVTGCAALVREYYVETRGHHPSAALLKATLINGTRQLTGADALADYPHIPNYHQGFGCIAMPDTIPNPGRPQLVLEFIDNWNDPTTQLASDQRRRYAITVKGGGELRLCLAYTDPPGAGLWNNLNLLVEQPGGGKKLFGNMQLPMSLGGPDAVNNVEILRIPNAAAGTYLVQIQATAILRGPQDFALVATGPLAGPIVAVPGGGA